jgi:2'-5' RNA ligase
MLRLFVGIYPTPEFAASALALLDGIGELPPRRASPAAQIHLTAQFIGETDPRRLEAVRESVARAASGLGSFSITVERLITLPRRGPARLVAVETDAPPPLVELHRRLVSRLARKPRKEASDRFVPHLTLCRFRAPTPGLRFERPAPIGGFEVREVRLMRSLLRPEGAEHIPIDAFSLA